MNISENDKLLVESVFQLPPFQNLEQEDKTKLSKLLNFFSTKSMDEISQKNKIIFIIEGKVEAKHSLKDQFTLVYNPGEVINEIAFYNTKHSPISLTALNNVKGFYIDPEQFKIFEKEHTLTAFNILQSFLKSISRHLRKVNSKITRSENNTSESLNRKHILKREIVNLSEHQLAAIRDFPFFKDFNTTEFKQLIGDIKPWKISNGNILFSEGDKANSCYILANGQIEVSINKFSNHVRLSLIEPGSLFGEIALIHLGLRSATCIAAVDSIVLEYAKRDFERLTDNYSILSYKILKNIALNLIEEYVRTLYKIKQIQ